MIWFLSFLTVTKCQVFRGPFKFIRAFYRYRFAPGFGIAVGLKEDVTRVAHQLNEEFLHHVVLLGHHRDRAVAEGLALFFQFLELQHVFVDVVEHRLYTLNAVLGLEFVVDGGDQAVELLGVVIDLAEHDLAGRPIERLAIMHVNVPEDAVRFQAQVLERLPFEGEVILTEFTPGLSVHSGAGLVGLVAVAAA